LEGFVDYATGGSMTGDYAVFQLAQSWTEDEVTWENAKKERIWANAGGDFVSKAIGKVTWPRSNGTTWIKFNVLPLIQSFVKIPDMNYGMLIRNVSGAQEIRLTSSEDSSVALHPRLTITYEEATSAITPNKTDMFTGATMNVRPHGLRFEVGNDAPATFVTVINAYGSLVAGGHLAAGSSRSVTGLGAGVYIVTFQQAGRAERMTVPIVP
jgi:hypothetical protein